MSLDFAFHSPVLYRVARDAMRRIPGDSDRVGGSPDALVAILFSAATLEAFVNEFGLMAGLRQHELPVLGVLATLLREVEDAQGQVRVKYQMARGVLTGTAFDVGAQPFQDFALLVRLRNDIVHMKAQLGMIDVGPGVVPARLPGVAERLRSLNVLAEYETHTKATWLHMVCTRAAAAWACTATKRMISAVIDALPQSSFQNQIRTLLSGQEMI